MKILAFDTSSSACSVALQDGDQIRVLHQIAPMQQARLILPMIQDLLDAASLSLHQLDAIAYGCGPGSFTGIRIASSVAQGIGFAAQLPIIQISSLAIMAQTAFIEQHKLKWLVTLDARMEQIYWGAYHVNQQGCVELIGQEQVGAPQEIQMAGAIVKEEGWQGIGDGWEKYANQIIAQLGFTPDSICPSQLPHASAMLTLAHEKLKRGDYITPAQSIPTYLR